MKESKQTLNPLSKETHADTPRSSDSLLSPAHTLVASHTHTVITAGERASDNTTPRSDLHVCEGQICTFHLLHTRSLSVIICWFTDAAADHTDQHPALLSELDDIKKKPTQK